MLLFYFLTFSLPFLVFVLPALIAMVDQFSRLFKLCGLAINEWSTVIADTMVILFCAYMNIDFSHYKEKH